MILKRRPIQWVSISCVDIPFRMVFLFYRMNDVVPSFPASDAPGSDLNERQRLFVEALVNDPRSKAKAVREAGYSTNGAKVQAHRLWADPAVRAYHSHLVLLRLGRAAAKAADTLELLLDHKSGFVRLEAAKDILDRAGFKPIERKAVLVGGSVSFEVDLSPAVDQAPAPSLKGGVGVENPTSSSEAPHVHEQ